MSSNKRVLLVDDSKVTARQLEQIIGSFDGFEVVGHAENGAEAVRLYGELSPDVVCMDIVMPLMDGLQATRSILQMDHDAKIIMISSVGGSRDTVLEALRIGAKNVIAKPFETDAVLKILQSL